MKGIRIGEGMRAFEKRAIYGERQRQAENGTTEWGEIR